MNHDRLDNIILSTPIYLITILLGITAMILSYIYKNNETIYYLSFILSLTAGSLGIAILTTFLKNIARYGLR